ncbi:MAG: SH3 domain-containing protein, partial [Bacteroidia bacterium]|nr:SH3 domain-containing protein [Bacteroidia bacterium]
MCNLSVVPVRKKPDDRSEMVTQLLYGELCRLIDKRSKNWLKIECVDDNYVGWLDIKQIYPLTATEFE